MEEGKSSRRILWRNVAITSGLLTIVAPLIGLLGTVFGMMDAFDTVGLEGGNDPARLARDIKLSMYTTIGGWGISLLCLIIFVISLILMIRARPRPPQLPAT